VVGGVSEHRQRRAQESSELLAYLRVLTLNAGSGRFLDVRWRTADGGMRRRFISSLRPQAAVRLIGSLARQTDVYVGVALRDGREHGGRRAIAGPRLVWADCDSRQATARVAAFAHRPSMLVASGSTGHVHAYWLLSERAAAGEVERMNRRLAAGLGADPASTDVARVLRPPGTRNHKHDPPRPVRVLALRPYLHYTLELLGRELPPDPIASDGDRPRWRARDAASPVQDVVLRAIPTAEYVRVLTGREPDRAGKVLCPFHSERTPSMQLYEDGSFYCFGRGCGRGGTLIDFAAHLWGITPRGEGFVELCGRLAEVFAS